jgi:hypothetical protein
MIRAEFAIVTTNATRAAIAVMGESRRRSSFLFRIHSPSWIVDVGRFTPRFKKEETHEVVQLVRRASIACGVLK